jgi:putative ABC transport system ATP-binding protein
MAEKEPLAVFLENVHKVYYTGRIPVHAISGITLAVEKGEFLVLMGPSGCGKSTLLHLIGGVDRPTMGSVWVNNAPLAMMNDNQLADFRRDQVGFVFQFYNLIPSLTAFENVEIPLSIKAIPPEERRKRVEELLKMVGLEDRAEHTPSLLSGGEQQRVSIARALANNPSLVLLDEPTGDLDQMSGEGIMRLLLELNKNKEKTYCMVTHDFTLARYGSKILRMMDGRIRAEEK